MLSKNSENNYSTATPFSNIGRSKSLYGGNNRATRLWYDSKIKKEGDMYSMFSKNSHFKRSEKCKSISQVSGSQKTDDIDAALERLKNNEFIPCQTYEDFIAKKKKGKRMYFVNKPPGEHAKELMKEYMA